MYFFKQNTIFCLNLFTLLILSKCYLYPNLITKLNFNSAEAKILDYDFLLLLFFVHKINIFGKRRAGAVIIQVYFNS